MWMIVVGCIASACNWSANTHKQSQTFDSYLECDRALISLAANWQASPNEGWTFNCVKKYD